MQKKDYVRALLEFKTASQAMSTDAEPYYQMGLAYLRMSNPRTAAAAFRRATELNPKHVEAQLKLAEVLTASRNQSLVAEASKRLETILANAPGNSDANDTLALAEWELGHATDATARIEATLEKSPAKLKASVALAKIKLSTGDLAGAESVLKNAVASAPQSPEPLLALAQLYWLAKQPTKAEAEIQQVLRLNARDGRALSGLAAIQTSGHRMGEAEETYKKLDALPDKEYKHLHALFLFQTGKREAALTEFIRLAKEDPEDRNARTRLLGAYVSMGKINDAEQLLAGALEKNPKDTEALFQRAELYLKSGDAQAAENDLKQVLHFKADSAQAHFALAEVYRATGSIETERQELTEALRLNAAMLPARLALARNFTGSRKAQSAVEILDQTPAQQKTLLGVVIERNWALFASGNYQEMRAAIDHALRAGRFPELLIQDGVLKMRTADYAGARAIADELLRRNPEDVRAARILADSYVAQKLPLKAVERLTELVEGRPKSAPLRYLLGQEYEAAGKAAEARQAFESAISADPNYIQADLSLAKLDHQEQRPDVARRHLTAVLNQDPKNVLALLMLGDIEAETGNRDGAAARYRAILDIDATNVLALNNLAWTLAPYKPDDALRYAQQADEISPDDASVADTLGWIYYRKGIYRIAVDYLRHSVARESTPRRQFHLAMSYIKMGDNEMGQKVLNAALQKDPNLPKTEQGW